MTKSTMLALIAWLGLSCGSSPPKAKPPKGGPPEGAWRLMIWIEDDPRMPADVVLEGCAPWKIMGVTCERTADKAVAAVRVHSDDGACQRWDDKAKRQRTTLAWAFHGGDIKMMMKCLTMERGAVQRRQLAGVVTHEIGHQVGVWEHVPYACKDAKIHAASKRPICGIAVMNPYYDPQVVEPTEIDAMAFDERDPLYSVLVSSPPPSDAPDCVYFAP